MPNAAENVLKVGGGNALPPVPSNWKDYDEVQIFGQPNDDEVRFIIAASRHIKLHGMDEQAVHFLHEDPRMDSTCE